MDNSARTPQKSARLPKYNRFFRWRLSELNKKTKPDKSEKLDSENIEALLSAVNNSSQHVRNFHITFLLAGIYIAIIIWSTTDMMLLKELPVNLPLLNAELSITGFYRFAPFFYILLHFNLLLQYCLLSVNLHSYNTALLTLEDGKARKYYDTRLFLFAFSHILSGAQHSRTLKLQLTLMIWTTIIWLPLSILIGLQIGFLPYHSEEVLQWQRWAIVADLFVLALFWLNIRSADGKSLTWFLRASGLLLVEGILIFITLIGAISFSWGLAVLPDKATWVSNYVPNAKQLTEVLFDGNVFHRNLSLREQLLIANEIKPEDVAYLTEEIAYNTEEDKKKLDDVLERIVGLDLKGRDLRYADFTQALMPKVDFRKNKKDELTKLNNALFEKSILFKAKMIEAQLQGAKLQRAQFQGANLTSAQLKKANLNYAQLQGADLTSAQLKKANLNYAQLQGADLNYAELQGASLRRAQLQRADLSYAHLQGADLGSADLQNANLRFAELQGAYLRYAKLQDTDLYGAKATRNK